MRESERARERGVVSGKGRKRGTERSEEVVSDTDERERKKLGVADCVCLTCI